LHSLRQSLHEALEHKLQSGGTLTNADVEEAAIEGAVQRLRPKLMTVCAVLASLIPILWESGIGSDVMKPIAAPIVGGMITSTIHVLILVPVFFVMMKERALRKGHLHPQGQTPTPSQLVPTVVLDECKIANALVESGDYLRYTD
jgi:Cu(I)/Ag(I) efflux system membrane protein CusA/SilA